MLTATRGGCRSRSPLPPSVEATDRPHPVINFLHGQASVVVGLHPFAGTWFRPENHLGVVGGDDIGECATNVGACIGVFQQGHAQHGIPGEDVHAVGAGTGHGRFTDRVCGAQVVVLGVRGFRARWRRRGVASFCGPGVATRLSGWDVEGAAQPLLFPPTHFRRTHIHRLGCVGIPCRRLARSPRAHTTEVSQWSIVGAEHIGHGCADLRAGIRVFQHRCPQCCRGR